MVIEIVLTGMIVSLIAVCILIYLAPEGYEDEKGFHYGKPTDNIKDYNEKDSTSSGTGTV